MTFNWDDNVNVIPIIPVSGRWDGWKINIRRNIHASEENQFFQGFYMCAPDLVEYGWAHECTLNDPYEEVYNKLMIVLNGPCPPDSAGSLELE